MHHLRDIITYFPKLRLRYPEHIPFGGSLSCMHWYMVLLYEAHSFTNEIYDWGKTEEKTAHVTLITPILGVVCLPKART